MGCKNNQKAAEAQSDPTSQLQTPAVIQVEKAPTPIPAESTQAFIEPQQPQSAIQTPPTAMVTANERTDSSYSLDKIKALLKDEKKVFTITESPNKKAVAYMVSLTGKPYEDMILHIWNVGDNKPYSATGDPLSIVGEVIWSPGSDYVFVDMGTYVTRGGILYSASTLQEAAQLGYLHSVYFSPDGKYLVYSKVSDSTSMKTVKSNYLDPGEAFDLVLYDITGKQDKLLFQGTETRDYAAIGWLNEKTVSYREVTYTAEGTNLHDQEIKYTYDISSGQIQVDPLQKNPTTSDQYRYIRSSLYKQKDVFGDVWSPDQVTVAYAKGDKEEGHGSVWMWRTGEEKPAQVLKEQMFHKIVWSGNSRYFIFNSGVSSEEDIHVVDAGNGEMQTLHCFVIENKTDAALPYFSPDSQYLLFSGVEQIKSTYKNTETGNSHNVSLLNLVTKEITVLLHPDDKVDYVPLGWSGQRKLVYKKTNFQTNREETVEYDLGG